MIVIILIGLEVRNEIRLRKFFKGKSGENLEEIIKGAVADLSSLKSTDVDIKKEIGAIKERMARSLRDAQTIRFNPFPDQGGNQSFAVALLNDKGDGVVLSSLYARERMSIFAKPVKNFASENELTEEEKSAINKFKNS